MANIAVYFLNHTISHFKYKDGELISIFAKLMNFKPEFILPKDNLTFGYQLANGSFVGNLAETEGNRVDILGNTRMIENYNTSNSIFLNPTKEQVFIFYIPKPEVKLMISITLFSLLDLETKIFVLILLSVFPVVYFLTHNYESNLEGVKKVTVVESLMFTFAWQCNEALKLPPPLFGTRIIFLAIMIYSTIFSSIFQSSIIKSLNSGVSTGDINTIQELIDANFSLVASDEFKPKLMKMKRYEGLVILNSTSSIGNNKKVAFLQSRPIAVNYLNELKSSGQDKFKIIPQKVMEYYISFMVPKSSPFQDRFNQIIRRSVESGIVSYQQNLAVMDLEISSLIKQTKNGFVLEKTIRIITVEDLMDTLIHYLEFSALALGAFLIEVLYHKFGARIKRIFIKLRRKK